MPLVRYTEKTASELCGAIKAGQPVTTACKAAGISRDTFYRWRKQHPEFDAQVAQAEGVREKLLLDQVETYGGAKGDWKAPAWLLERTSRDFREVRETKLAVQKGVEEVLDAVRGHMSEAAYMELIDAIAAIEGVDTAEGESAASTTD